MDHPKRDPFVEIYLQLAEALKVLRDAREETEVSSKREADPETGSAASGDPSAAE